MNIAIFCPNWVGDVVMATPALRALRNHHPDARLIAIIRPYVAPVLHGLPWFDDIWHLDARGGTHNSLFNVASRLRQHRPDLAVLFSNSLRTAWVAWLGRCRRRVGYAMHGRRWLLTDPLHLAQSTLAFHQPNPVLLAYNYLAEYLGCPDPTCRMELAVSPADEQAVEDLWRQFAYQECREVVCLNPGAAFGAAKCWPTEHFAHLARSLVSRRGAGVLVLCGPAEKALAQAIVQAAASPLVHSLAEVGPSIGLTKACIRKATLLITTDSGPRHFAAAFGTPVLTLFGPTHIAWTETYQPGAANLQKKVSCGPCQKRKCPLDHRCMTSLQPAEVLTVASQMLDSPGVCHLPLAA